MPIPAGCDSGPVPAAGQASDAHIGGGMPIIAYVSLGSNMGDREENIDQAIALLAEAGRVTAISSLYATEPVGYKEQEDFLNAVAAVETALSAPDLLARCLSIEDRLGRSRSMRWGPRTIDLDILLYGDAILNTPTLQIPHPRMAERKFVLEPLAEIAPAAVHPVLLRTAAELLRELKDRHAVTRYCSGDSKP
jgi:2-amino-4-hydroxy-6-hydroxymethyldihydropteridine diphosphokinase